MSRSAHVLLPGVAEAHVLEADALLVRAVGDARSRQRRRAGGASLARVGIGEVREQVRHVEVVLVHAADRREDRLERLLALAERERRRASCSPSVSAPAAAASAIAP